MATNIIETPERSQTGLAIGNKPQQEQIPATTGLTFTAEQRKILAQTYQMILSWAKPKAQASVALGADSASVSAVQTEA